MSLFNFFKKQLSTVISWNPQQTDMLLWKYPAKTDEIKNASKLIVGPGQGCILVYEGKITDVLDQEGTYTIKTDNLPFITTLLKVMQLMESEHKVALFFYRKAEVVNQSWGTSSPVKYVDPIYKIPVKMSAFGNFSYQMINPHKVFADLVGSTNEFTTESFRDIVQSRIPSLLISYLANQKMSYTEIDTQLTSIMTEMRTQLISEFEKLGVRITDFRVEGNSFDADTEERIGRVADVTIDAMAAAEGGLSYEQLEKLRALRDAARNESGVAGAGAALGAGLSMANVFNKSIDEVTTPSRNADPIAQLQKLKLLLDESIITQQEFDQKKKEYLENL
ncbi:SPFH domain-containing protein [Sphingobacterium chungjuense]|uniref:SPFH domain-containing protein n=1 Tax=Sphingobacterium chungjuense TaxID=2675553 RepID=UPI0014078F1F|nr:SPFH domain-containing protein [Sphingobacterium chungjuense]